MPDAEVLIRCVDVGDTYIVWRWLDEGAHFYVCGDAGRMARDVDDALTDIIRTHGGMSAEAARDYKRELVAEKRYVRDVY